MRTNVSHTESWIANERLIRGIKAFIVTLYLAGLIGLSLEITAPYFRKVIWLNLVLSNGLLFAFHKKWDIPFAKKILSLFLLVFFIEVLGVQTGLPFGNYYYGSLLGPKVLQTPILIGLNWVMLVYCVHILLNSWKAKSHLKYLGGALLLVGYDMLLEPIAVDWGLWTWADGSIPMENYLSWFAISFVMLAVLESAKTKGNNPIAITLFTAQIIFFLSLNVLRLL